MPRHSRRFARFAAPIALLVIGVSGCAPADTIGSTAQSTAPTLPTVPYAPSTAPAAPEAVDYLRLLPTAAELTDTDDTFNQQSQQSQPNGMPGASAFFVNDKDTRAISDTFLVYQDAATATATLRQAAGTLPTLVNGGTPTPVPVGTDGVMIKGSYPNQEKDVTLMLFTEGPALVRLEFQSANGDPTTDRFVASVGKMQQIALRVGLPTPGTR
ncbi:hypothetical protein BH09ACT8_BH09ACT8_29080 [soil metagenome]